VKELFGEPPQARVENGIGIVPVSGILGQGLMPIEKLLGATDTGDLSATLDAFASDTDVHALLLDIDSPGGTVTGIPELAAQIAAFPKPTYGSGARPRSFFAPRAPRLAPWAFISRCSTPRTPSRSAGCLSI
jgi:hypothetical protein